MYTYIYIYIYVYIEEGRIDRPHEIPFLIELTLNSRPCGTRKGTMFDRL